MVKFVWNFSFYRINNYFENIFKKIEPKNTENQWIPIDPNFMKILMKTIGVFTMSIDNGQEWTVKVSTRC